MSLVTFINPPPPLKRNETRLNLKQFVLESRLLILADVIGLVLLLHNLCTVYSDTSFIPLCIHRPLDHCGLGFFISFEDKMCCTKYLAHYQCVSMVLSC